MWRQSEDRALGAFLGLAVGDALGTTLEFTQRDSRPLHTEMVGGGVFRLEPGVWTDDTQMALALAESLAAQGQVDERDLMRRFVGWLRNGDYSPTGVCFDCGMTTRAAIEHFERTGDPIAGNRDPRSAGNGCLMRLCPVAIFHHQDEEKAAVAARRQSATTHGAIECLHASEYFARLLVRAIGGLAKRDLMEPMDFAGGGRVSEIARGSWIGKARDEIRASGYVIDTLEAALWAVGHAENFEDAVVAAVNLGEDSDTVGAVTGQLAGAIWGRSGIPDRWVEPIAWRPRLEMAVRALL